MFEREEQIGFIKNFKQDLLDAMTRIANGSHDIIKTQAQRDAWVEQARAMLKELDVELEKLAQADVTGSEN